MKIDKSFKMIIEISKRINLLSKLLKVWRDWRVEALLSIVNDQWMVVLVVLNGLVG